MSTTRMTFQASRKIHPRRGSEGTRLRSALVGLLSVGVFVAASCGNQPKTNCLTSTAPYAMKLIERSRLESTAGSCSGFGPAAFNVDPEVGFISYYPKDSKGQPNYAKGSLAIQTTELGNLVFTAEGFGVQNTATDGTRYSLGAYSVTEPNDENLCPAPTLSPTHVVLAELPAIPDDPATPDVDESFAGQPAIDAKLEWSNVAVYLTAASFGTQIQADLVDTRLTPAGDSCKINYRTVSLAPAVPCGATDADGNPLTNADGTPQLDPTLCDPDANPALGRFTGSGIGPNTRYVCDPDSAFCVLDGDTVPALKSGAGSSSGGAGGTSAGGAGGTSAGGAGGTSAGGAGGTSAGGAGGTSAGGAVAAGGTGPGGAGGAQ